MLSSIVHPPFRMLLPDGARRTGESLRAHGQRFGESSVPEEICERFGDGCTLFLCASVVCRHDFSYFSWSGPPTCTLLCCRRIVYASFMPQMLRAWAQELAPRLILKDMLNQ